MSPDDTLPVNLRETEMKLATLAPATARIARDRLMFEAGRAAGELAASTAGAPAERVWRRAALALAASVVVLATATLHAYLTRPAVQREVVYVPHGAEARPAQASAEPERKGQIEHLEEPRTRPAAPPADVRPRDDRLAIAPANAPYLFQRNLALERGIDTLPLSKAAVVDAPPSPSVRDLLEELLPRDPVRRSAVAGRAI